MLWLIITCSNTDLCSVKIQLTGNAMVKCDDSYRGINEF